MFVHLKNFSSIRISKTSLYAIKGIGFLVFLVLLYYSLFYQRDVSTLYIVFRSQLRLEGLPYLLAAVSLVLINWWLEALKWQYLMKPIETLRIGVALRAVLIGVCSSIFTPNRIGEYFGRVFATTQNHRWQAAAALTFGSVVQISLISTLGLIALGNIFGLNNEHLEFNVWTYVSIALIALVLLLSFLFIGPLIRCFQRSISKVHHKAWPYLQFLTKYSSKELWILLSITLIRILVYVIQYLALVRFFGISVASNLVIYLILITYLIQTVLPLPTFLGLLARGEITLLVWKYVAVNELSVLAASYGLWVINVVFPALVGMVLVLKLEPKRVHKQ